MKEEAQHLLEQAQVRQKTFSGTSNVLSLQTGGKFSLELEQAAKYLSLKTQHVGHFPKSGHRKSTLAPGEVAGREGFRNSFECLPLPVPYRTYTPIPRPKIEGSVLATVVGPSSQDVHTDPHGRVRIRFHWDRKSKKVDSRRLCWARVSQAWAGMGFGTMFIPRIGMEVIVHFIEGDPDWPIVMGCVYNDVNYPPLQLDDDKANDQTKSIIRTRTAPQEKGKPVGYNSIEFEDMADQEMFAMHAQRDMMEEVLHDHEVTVKNDETIAVERHQSETIGGDLALTVKGARSASVAKNDTLSVDGSRSASIAKNDGLNVEGSLSVSVTKLVTQTYQADHQRSVTGSQTLSVDKDKKESIKGAYELATDKKYELKQGATTLMLEQDKVLLKGGGTIKIQRESAVIEIASNGEITINTGEAVKISGGGATITMKGGKVVVDSSDVDIGS